MIQTPTCRSCGRQIHFAQPVTFQELQSGKKFTCRDCRREPVDVALPLQQVIRRIGRKPAAFEAR